MCFSGCCCCVSTAWLHSLTHQYSFHTQGVRALALRSGGGELVSAGGDGRLVAWDVAGGGGLGRATASMRVSQRGVRAHCL